MALRTLMGGVLNRGLSVVGLRLVRAVDTQPLVDPIGHNSTESVDGFYSDKAFVRAYASPERLAFFREVVARASGRGARLDGADVADAGCGTGHLLAEVAGRSRPASISGFEYSQAALEVAERTVPQARLAPIDLVAGHVPENRFDTVFCTEVLEHLLQPEAALDALQRMVRPGGTLVVTVPDGRQDVFAGHINFWSPESWRQFLLRNARPGTLVHTEVFGARGQHNLGVMRCGSDQDRDGAGLHQRGGQ